MSELVGPVARLLHGLLHELLLVKSRYITVGESLHNFINNLRRSLGFGSHRLLCVWRRIVYVHGLETAVLAVVQRYSGYVVVSVLSV